MDILKRKQHQVMKTKKSPFEKRMDELRAYKKKHGHVNVKHKDVKSLYQFCIQMKYARNNPEKSNTVLTDDRITSLNALGFDWTAREKII